MGLGRVGPWEPILICLEVFAFHVWVSKRRTRCLRWESDICWVAIPRQDDKPCLWKWHQPSRREETRLRQPPQATGRSPPSPPLSTRPQFKRWNKPNKQNLFSKLNWRTWMLCYPPPFWDNACQKLPLPQTQEKPEWRIIDFSWPRSMINALQCWSPQLQQLHNFTCTNCGIGWICRQVEPFLSGQYFGSSPSIETSLKTFFTQIIDDNFSPLQTILWCRLFSLHWN